MRFKYSADLRRSGLVNRIMKLLDNFAAWFLFGFFNINLFHKNVIVSVFDVVSYFKNFSNQRDFTFGLYNSKSRKTLVVKKDSGTNCAVLTPFSDFHINFVEHAALKLKGRNSFSRCL